MKTMRAISLAAGLLTASFGLAGPAQAQDARFEAVYTISANIGAVGDFNYHFAQTGASYEASAQRQVTGLARALVGESQNYTYSVRGAVENGGRLQPAAYRHQGGKKNRLVQATFTSDDIVTTANPRMGMGHPPATQAQRRGAIDQLSAIASMVTAQGDPCSRTVPVYLDGRSRFDFVFRPNGQVAVNTSAYQGQAVRCSVDFRPIAGFSDPQEPATLTFLFARTSSGLYAPIRIQMPSDNGLVTLEARQLTVNGARLR